MTKTKIDYARNWLRLAEQATEAAEEFNKIGCQIEARKKLLISDYCYNRYLKDIKPMLSRRKDKMLNILGAIFSIGVAALITYLIINKKL